MSGRPKVGVVGPCGAGKSLLVAALRQRGITAREVAQEHSYVPSKRQRITNPDLLIYLHVSQKVAQRRMGRVIPSWAWEALEERLAHARAHADLWVDTDNLTPEGVLETVSAFLDRKGGLC